MLNHGQDLQHPKDPHSLASVSLLRVDSHLQLILHTHSACLFLNHDSPYLSFLPSDLLKITHLL